MKPDVEDHRVRTVQPAGLLMNKGMRGKCGICGQRYVELPKGMKVHAGGILTRPRTDVPSPVRKDRT